MDFLEYHRDLVITGVIEHIHKKWRKIKIITEQPQLFIDWKYRELKFREDDTIFVFDEESLAYLRSFIEDGETLVMYREGKNKYLGKVSNTNPLKYPDIKFFHIYLMQGEINKEREKRKIDDLVVHHRNRKSYDNRKDNLQVLTKEEHFLVHHWFSKPFYKPHPKVIYRR